MQKQGNERNRRKSLGIEERHQRGCRSADGGRCDCQPAFRAEVYDRARGTKVRKTFPTRAAAKTWRTDAASELNRGRRIATTRITLRAAADAWVAGATAEPPRMLTRSGRRYKPSVLRGYEADLRNYVLPDLGGALLSDIRRGDLQALVDRMLGAGLSASKVRNALMPVRAIYRCALERDEVAHNPTSNLRLPAELGRRERVASPTEAAALIAALPESDRAVWATACYAGLRLGELRALRWSDVDLAGGTISVERALDAKGATIDPKSAKGRRRVPLTTTLRETLAEHKARTGRDGDDLVFGTTARRPFTPKNVRRKADHAWNAANAKRRDQGREPLQSIGFHELRHTFVSLMHDAGISLERIGDYVGHSSQWMTDRYRHLVDGHEAQATRMLDDYLVRADTARRVEQLEFAP